MKESKWLHRYFPRIAGICLTLVLCTAVISLTACGKKEGSTTIELENPAGTQKDAEKDSKESSSSDHNSAGSGEDENSREVDAKQALALALTHAGLTEQDISSNKVEEDMEDGQRVFEVEFFSADGAEYEYELSAQDGTIFRFSYDAEKVFSKTDSSGAETVSEEDAKNAVLERVPKVSADEIKMSLIEDDGWMKYEAYLFYEGMQQEFEIDAGSGKLIEWEGELPGH